MVKLYNARVQIQFTITRITHDRARDKEKSDKFKLLNSIILACRQALPDVVGPAEKKPRARVKGLATSGKPGHARTCHLNFKRL